MSEQWIIVPNWDEFQHYKDRSPTWIKLYTSLVDNYEWQGMSLADRGIMVTLWVGYARTNGVLGVVAMCSLCGPHANRYGNIDKALKRLNDAGFIELSASKPLARRYQHASPEKEKEKKGARTRSRARASAAPSEEKLSRYTLAEAMTRNVGVQYTLASFREELDRFDLDTKERDLLEELRTSLLNGTTDPEDDLF